MDRAGLYLIARPAREGDPAKPPGFLELNATQESLEFTAIGGDIPNRGDVEATALLHAVHYLQTVADCADNQFIHKEPGLWLHVPKTAENGSETYVRQAVIPRRFRARSELVLHDHRGRAADRACGQLSIPPR
jgi:hypothetical protein